jgi:hypothetical protein
MKWFNYEMQRIYTPRVYENDTCKILLMHRQQKY